MLLLRWWLRVDGDDVVHTKLSQLSLSYVCPAFISRGVGGARVHHAMQLDVRNIGCGHCFLRTGVGVLPHGDDMLRLEQTDDLQKGCIAEGIQLPKNFDWHVRGRHILSCLRHEGQGTEVVDGAVTEKTLGSGAQSPEQLPKSCTRHL